MRPRPRLRRQIGTCAALNNSLFSASCPGIFSSSSHTGSSLAKERIRRLARPVVCLLAPRLRVEGVPGGPRGGPREKVARVMDPEELRTRSHLAEFLAA